MGGYPREMYDMCWIYAGDCIFHRRPIGDIEGHERAEQRMLPGRQLSSR